MVYLRSIPMLSFVAGRPLQYRNASIKLALSPRRRLVNSAYSRATVTAVIPEASHLLQDAAAATNLSTTQTQDLLKLADLLLSESAKYNLTAIRTPDAIIRKHIIDALNLLPTLDAETPRSVIDVGTGAGFPGLVLAIARPELKISLLDSVRKKTVFHELVIRALGLGNVNSVWARAEHAGQDADLRERFCVTVARSVAEMRVLAELTLPLTRVGGCVLAQKSAGEDQEEILAAARSIKRCGGVVEDILCGTQLDPTLGSDSTDGLDEDRRRKVIIVVRKQVATPTTYPRKPGVPKKSPL